MKSMVISLKLHRITVENKTRIAIGIMQRPLFGYDVLTNSRCWMAIPLSSFPPLV